MNSDDFMSDPAHPMHHPAGAKGAAWNTQRFRDEYEMYKNRLQDQRFSVGEFPTFILRPTMRVTIPRYTY